MSLLSVPIMMRGRFAWDALRLPREELDARRDKMCELLVRHGLDGVLCYADSSCNGYVEYFTNYNCVQPFTNVILILQADGRLCLVASVPPRDVQRLRNGIIPDDVELLTVGMSPLACDHVGQKAVEYLAQKGLDGKRWGGINLSRAMKKTLNDLEKAIPDIADLTAEFEAMRAVKSSVELGVISQAASFARQAALDVIRACQEGADECEATAQADQSIRRAGAEDIQLFVGSSKTGNYLRLPQKRVLSDGETLKVLCQVQYLRYRGLFAATAVIGKGYDDAAARVKAQAENYTRLLGRIQAGAALTDEWKTALNTDKNTHSAIHGIGQDLIESPFGGVPACLLEENMVLGVTWESHADCAIFADTILCTKQGAVSLSGNALAL